MTFIQLRDNSDYRMALGFGDHVYMIPRIFIELEGWEDITDIWDSGFEILKMTFPKIRMTKELYDDVRHILLEKGYRHYFMGSLSGWSYGWNRM